jgi:opacity protein-like surface antigen
VRAGVIALAVLTLVGRAAPASAEGFVSPFLGYNFGGDSGCPQITNCDDKRLNVGVAIGALGSVFGVEEEFGYAKDFFGSAPNLDSSVLTVMSNLMIVPNLGPVRPYVLGGLGLVKTHVSFNPGSLLTSENNNVGWDVGGGLIVLFSSHVGLRGDLRYIHSFQDLDTLGFSGNQTKLDFGRFSGALIFAF